MKVSAHQLEESLCSPSMYTIISSYNHMQIYDDSLIPSAKELHSNMWDEESWNKDFAASSFCYSGRFPPSHGRCVLPMLVVCSLCFLLELQILALDTSDSFEILCSYAGAVYTSNFVVVYIATSKLKQFHCMGYGVVSS